MENEHSDRVNRGDWHTIPDLQEHDHELQALDDD